MAKKMNRVLALLLVAVMMIGLLPTVALADDASAPEHASDPGWGYKWACEEIPAHLDTSRTICGLEAHTHSTDTCAYHFTCTEPLHEHTEACYTCTLPEHTHTEKPNRLGYRGETDGCWKWSFKQWDWVLNCGKTEHTHGDGTCNSVLNCDDTHTEHSLANGCDYAFDCEIPEHTHDTTVSPDNQCYAYVPAAHVCKKVASEVVEAKVYLLLQKVDGQTIPPTINKGFAANWFGPSQNDIPYFTVRVDMDRLEKNIQRQGSGTWFVSIDNTAYTPATGATRMDQAAQVWGWIYNAMDEASQEKFDSTFGEGVYMGYVLKKQGEGDIHIDGVLTTTPPIYHYDVMDTTANVTAATATRSKTEFTASELKTDVEDYLSTAYGDLRELEQPYL